MNVYRQAILLGLLYIAALLFFCFTICRTPARGETVPMEQGASLSGGGGNTKRYYSPGGPNSLEALTCASGDYRDGVYLRVRNPETGCSIVARVDNQALAQELGRPLYLSRRAFYELAPPGKETIKVEVEVYDPGWGG